MSPVWCDVGVHTPEWNVNTFGFKPWAPALQDGPRECGSTLLVTPMKPQFKPDFPARFSLAHVLMKVVPCCSRFPGEQFHPHDIPGQSSSVPSLVALWLQPHWAFSKEEALAMSPLSPALCSLWHHSILRWAQAQHSQPCACLGATFFQTIKKLGQILSSWLANMAWILLLQFHQRWVQGYWWNIM